jgi:uncharacterized membrane protein (DUF2068 family)
MRFIEAFGLWHQKPWAEWFAISSGGIYLVLEVYALAKGVTASKMFLLVVNLIIVAYLLYKMRARGQAAHNASACHFGSHSRLVSGVLDSPSGRPDDVAR